VWGAPIRLGLAFWGESGMDVGFARDAKRQVIFHWYRRSTMCCRWEMWQAWLPSGRAEVNSHSDDGICDGGAVKRRRSAIQNDLTGVLCRCPRRQFCSFEESFDTYGRTPPTSGADRSHPWILSPQNFFIVCSQAECLLEQFWAQDRMCTCGQHWWDLWEFLKWL